MPLSSQTLVPDDSAPQGKAGVDYYFIQDDGGMFKTTITHEPYFFIATRVSNPLPGPRTANLITDGPAVASQKGHEGNVEEWIMRKYEGLVTKITKLSKEDLKLVRPSLCSLLPPCSQPRR